MLVRRSVLPLIDDYVVAVDSAPGSSAAREDSDAEVTATLRLAHHHGLKRLVAAHPGLITVLGPADARDAVADWAAAGLAQYRTTSAS